MLNFRNIFPNSFPTVQIDVRTKIRNNLSELFITMKSVFISKDFEKQDKFEI